MLFRRARPNPLRNRIADRYIDCQRRFLDLFLKRHETAMSYQEIRRARVLVALLIFGILAMSSMAVVRFATEGFSTTPLLVGAGALAMLGSLVYFIRTGNNSLSGDLLIGAVMVTIMLTAYNDNGLHSRVLTWLPSLPLIANFTEARLNAIRTTLLGLVGLIWLLVLHRFQVLETSLPDESLIGRLAAGFGSMLFVSVIAYAYEDSRRRAEEERESLSRTRDDWVSVVSHELRTPLTSLYGGLKLVAGGKLDNEPQKYQSLLTMATRNTERLLHLVDDILDVEKLSGGGFDLQVEPIDLRQVIDEAIKTQQYLADECQVVLEARLEPLPEIMADYNRLLQVVQNLLSNAIKFSDAGGEVVVQLTQSDGRVFCQVMDQGAGVSELFRDRLFERFAQQESGTRRRSGGTGLGLFICRGIIELHGGKIGYRARPGGGSAFYFELPPTVSVSRTSKNRGKNGDS